MASILLLAANPIDSQAQLQLNQEIREIDQEIRNARFGTQFEFKPKVAVRLKDLSQYLESVQPDIVHFSGHGSRTSEIILLDDHGNSRPVSQEAIKKIFSLLKGNIRCLVINACNGEPLADALAKDIDCAIGMLDEIDDSDAIEFSREFYRHLANGKDVQTAYDLGCAQIEIPNEKNLVRLHARRADPSKVVFVKSNGGGGGKKPRAKYGAIGIVGVVLSLVVIMISWGWNKLPNVLNWSIPNATPTAQFAPSITLDKATVDFMVTLDQDNNRKVRAGGTLNVAPGNVFVFQMNVTVDGTPFPHELIYRYSAVSGSIPAKQSGPTASYVAPNQPGTDVISAQIIDPNDDFQILRSINVVIQQK